MSQENFEPGNIEDEQPGSVAQQLDSAEQEAQEQELLKMSVLGDAAQSFVDSELGQEMVRRAKEIVLDAALDLVQIPSQDTEAIIEKQIEAKSASLFMVMIEQITSEGSQAYQSLVAMLEADGRNRS